MKTKVTQKEIREGFYNIQSIPYCDLQTILDGGPYNPTYYNSGVYGWNFDVYTDPEFPNTCICTGYRSNPGKMILSREEIAEFEKRGGEAKNREERKAIYHEVFRTIFERGLKRFEKQFA